MGILCTRSCWACNWGNEVNILLNSYLFVSHCCQSFAYLFSSYRAISTVIVVFELSGQTHLRLPLASKMNSICLNSFSIVILIG